jgi:hypothetical protein
MKSFLTTVCCLITLVSAAQFTPNYDESKIPDYVLPEILKSENGKPVTTTKQWESLRRPEILSAFERQVYGRVPEDELSVKFSLLESSRIALNGKAIRKQVSITFTGKSGSHAANLLVYLPKNTTGPIPVFLGYNFYGNHTVFPDERILISENWVMNNHNNLIFNNKADERSRGWRAGRWPLLQILERGYGLAVMYYGDIDPDYDDGFGNGIHNAVYEDGQKPGKEEWGSISAWAYGLSAAMDYFEIDPDIDQGRIAVLGHSRLGKTSLWAGARDVRFAMVISNESGCGGAALSRRRIGETVERINTAFPHWFCDNFNQYNEREDALPVDQHQLIALIAPRPVYIASAAGDEWADPKGEYLSGYYATAVYKLYGLKGLTTDQMPEVNNPVKSGHVGYHIRSGEHDLTYYDWEQFMDFADLHLKQGSGQLEGSGR